ncbi:helix-turn-helix transcriptional regulator [Saccharothrix sp. S26]|nr:helix-turn-helix transcriptional regulator [Saccharothrix sp. S26]
MGAEGELARLQGGDGGDGGGEAGVEGWRVLSRAERDIARLVGAGLTNRQVAKQLFLSPHTVNYHLRGIFRKLGISSRVELARVAHEQEGTHEQEGAQEGAGVSPT